MGGKTELDVFSCVVVVFCTELKQDKQEKCAVISTCWPTSGEFQPFSFRANCNPRLGLGFDLLTSESMHAEVLPWAICLDYCNAILAGLPKTTIAPQQRAQNAVARLVAQLWPRDHFSNALRDLHWLPVQQRITYNYKFCLLMHLVHNDRAQYT